MDVVITLVACTKFVVYSTKHIVMHPLWLVSDGIWLRLNQRKQYKYKKVSHKWTAKHYKTAKQSMEIYNINNVNYTIGDKNSLSKLL